MNGPEEAWELLIGEAFALTKPTEDAAWQRFEASLPERQSWLAFYLALEEARPHLRQAMTWVHRAYSPRAGCAVFSAAGQVFR